MDSYRDEMGVLPEALFNYLLRLGWGHGDDEIIAREQAVEWFDIAHVGKSPSRFDLAKLLNLNGHYLREADDARLAALVAPMTAKLVDRDLTADDQALLTKAMAALKPRARAAPACQDRAPIRLQAPSDWLREPRLSSPIAIAVTAPAARAARRPRK